MSLFYNGGEFEGVAGIGARLKD